MLLQILCCVWDWIVLISWIIWWSWHSTNRIVTHRTLQRCRACLSCSNSVLLWLLLTALCPRFCHITAAKQKPNLWAQLWFAFNWRAIDIASAVKLVKQNAHDKSHWTWDMWHVLVWGVALVTRRIRNQQGQTNKDYGMVRYKKNKGEI